MLKKTRMIPVEYELLCDCCGDSMEFTGRTLTVNPPLHPHRCKSCGDTSNFRSTYPRIEYEKPWWRKLPLLSRL